MIAIRHLHEDGHESPLAQDFFRPLKAFKAVKPADARQVAGNPPIGDMFEVGSKVIGSLMPDLVDQGRGKIIVYLGEKPVGFWCQLVNVARPPHTRPQASPAN
jgi:hypothetical protein